MFWVINNTLSLARVNRKQFKAEDFLWNAFDALQHSLSIVSCQTTVTLCHMANTGYADIFMLCQISLTMGIMTFHFKPIPLYIPSCSILRLVKHAITSANIINRDANLSFQRVKICSYCVKVRLLQATLLVHDVTFSK